MTAAKWLVKVSYNKEALKALIAGYHPVNRQPGTRRATVNSPGDYITAPNAEAIRAAIRTEFEGDPVVQFEAALVAGNHRRVYTILEQTWFGVPESTECWNLEGFREVVAFMDDPPEEDTP